MPQWTKLILCTKAASVEHYKACQYSISLNLLQFLPCFNCQTNLLKKSIQKVKKLQKSRNRAACRLRKGKNKGKFNFRNTFLRSYTPAKSQVCSYFSMRLTGPSFRVQTLEIPEVKAQLIVSDLRPIRVKYFGDLRNKFINS